MPAYQPTLDLELQYCQAKDCTEITLTDVSPVFLDYGLNWLKIKGITIEVYDQEGILLGSKIVDDYYTSLSGDITLDNTTTAVGNGTLFTEELAENDYIICLLAGQEFTYRVGEIVSDTEMVLTTVGNPAVAASGIGKLNLEYTLDATHFGAAAGESIPDGIYDIKYIITLDYTWDDNGADTVVTGEEQFMEETQVIYCNIQCCVAKKLADISNDFISDPCGFANSDDASEAM